MDASDLAVMGSVTLLDAAWLMWTSPDRRPVVFQEGLTQEVAPTAADEPVAGAAETLVVIRGDAWGSVGRILSRYRGCRDWYLEAPHSTKRLTRIRRTLALAGAVVRLIGRGGRIRRWLRLRVADGAVYRSDTIWRPAGSVPGLLRELAISVIRGDGISVVFGQSDDSLLARIVESGAGWVGKDVQTLHFGSGRVFRVVLPGVVVRIPRGDAAAKRCSNAFSALKSLEVLKLSFTCPRPLRESRISGQLAYVESRVDGHEYAYQEMTSESVAAVRIAAIGMIAEIHQKSSDAEPLAESDVRDMLGQSMDCLLGLPFDEGLVSDLQGLVSTLCSGLVSRKLPAVLSHGDFKIANLVAGKERQPICPVDWDRSCKRGIPAVDVVQYLAFDRSVRDRRSMSLSIVDAMRDDFSLPEVRSYCDRFSLDRRAWVLAGVATLVMHVAGQRVAGTKIHQSWLRVQADALVGAISLLRASTS